jgi:hypothetical protein
MAALSMLLLGLLCLLGSMTVQGAFYLPGVTPVSFEAGKGVRT